MLWGVKTKQQVIETGSFRCPQCGKKRSYIREETQQFRYAFFVPLHQTKTKSLVDTIKCQSCQRTFAYQGFRKGKNLR